MTKNETKPQDAAKALADLRERHAAGGRKAWANLSKQERTERARSNSMSGDTSILKQREAKKPYCINMMPRYPDAYISSTHQIPRDTISRWRKEAGIPTWKRTPKSAKNKTK